MTEFLAGPTMVLTWTTANGTTSLAGDYRTCTWTPSTAYAEASAGSDTQIGRLPALSDAKANVTLVAQTGGTSLVAQLQPKKAGTLTIQPEGTASNLRKITFPSYCDGAVFDHPYADVVGIAVGFTGAGNLLNNFTDGVNA
jgi:hypothetical protein